MKHNFRHMVTKEYILYSLIWVVLTTVFCSIIFTLLSYSSHPYAWEFALGHLKSAVFFSLLFFTLLIFYRGKLSISLSYLSNLARRINRGQKIDEHDLYKKHNETKDIFQLRLQLLRLFQYKERDIIWQQVLIGLHHALHFEKQKCDNLSKELSHRSSLSETANRIQKTLTTEIRRQTYSALHNISSIVEMLKNNSKGEDKHRFSPKDQVAFFKMIEDEVKSIQQFTAGGFKHEIVTPQLLVNECVTFYAGIADKRQITITVEHSPKLPKWHVDKIKFIQIILGCIYRSISVLPRGKSITISLKIIRKKYKKYLYVTVKDDGLGLSEEDRKSIFNNEAEQYDSHSDGTNISFSIIEKLMVLHNGFAELDDQNGEGSFIHLYFPYFAASDLVTPGPKLPSNVIQLRR